MIRPPQRDRVPRFEPVLLEHAPEMLRVDAHVHESGEAAVHLHAMHECDDPVTRHTRLQRPADQRRGLRLLLQCSEVVAIGNVRRRAAWQVGAPSDTTVSVGKPKCLDIVEQSETGVQDVIECRVRWWLWTCEQAIKLGNGRLQYTVYPIDLALNAQLRRCSETVSRILRIVLELAIGTVKHKPDQGAQQQGHSGVNAEEPSRRIPPPCGSAIDKCLRIAERHIEGCLRERRADASGARRAHPALLLWLPG